MLARDTPRGLRDFLRTLNDRIKKGEPLGDALLQQRPRVSELEATIITAAGRSGRLDRGCDQLARYFEALGRARGAVFSRSTYSVVMVHLTLFVVKLPVLIGSGVGVYLRAVAGQLIIIYALVAGIWLGWKSLVDAARRNVAVDKTLRRIPGLGSIREKFALARFFSTLDAQLEAQVNIWDAFANAARTSDSARIIHAAREAMPMLQSGERLSEALAKKKVIPEEYVRSFRVAEETGELDAELTALAQRSEELAVAALNRWAEWLPKMIYVAMLAYAGWQIVSWYSGYLKSLDTIGQ